MKTYSTDKLKLGYRLSVSSSETFATHGNKTKPEIKGRLGTHLEFLDQDSEAFNFDFTQSYLHFPSVPGGHHKTCLITYKESSRNVCMLKDL